jgi:hypothetical protein
VEQLFLKQELEFCDKIDLTTINSLNIAISLFNDAMTCLKTVELSMLYQAAATTYPTLSKYRLQSFLPRDAFHIACNSHRTRLQNTLRTPGMNMDEKTLIRQRANNMIAAKEAYIELQKKALSAPK